MERDGERTTEIMNGLKNVEDRGRRWKKGKKMKKKVQHSLPFSRAVLRSFISRLNRLVMPSEITAIYNLQIRKT